MQMIAVAGKSSRSSSILQTVLCICNNKQWCMHAAVSLAHAVSLAGCFHGMKATSQ